MKTALIFTGWVLLWAGLLSAVCIFFWRRYGPKKPEPSPWAADLQCSTRKPGDPTEETDAPLYKWLR